MFNPGRVLGAVTFNPFIWFFLQPQVVSSHACADQTHLNTQGGHLQSSLLCISLSEVLRPTNSSCFGLPELFVPCPQFKVPTRL